MQLDVQMRREETVSILKLNMLTRNNQGMLLPDAPSYPTLSTYGYVSYDPDSTQDGL